MNLGTVVSPTAIAKGGFERIRATRWLHREAFRLHRITLALVLTCFVVSGCERCVHSVRAEEHEGDNEWNYQHVFGTRPPTVTVINSVLISYSYPWYRYPCYAGVVTTDDFEFELLVPRRWIEERLRLFVPVGGLQKDEDAFARRRLGARKDHPFRPWYAPKPINSYDLYHDLTSATYVHMLVDKEIVGDRYRAFISKH
ncbi:MAG: hypothetical protein HY699_22590 [Deltaproteobacteria bacterium]|nr:hypothetical protein [Deltaproteobacteria bacterium]